MSKNVHQTNVHNKYTINKGKCEVKCQRVIYMLFANEQHKAVLTYCTVELLHNCALCMLWHTKYSRTIINFTTNTCFNHALMQKWLLWKGPTKWMAMRQRNELIRKGYKIYKKVYKKVLSILLLLLLTGKVCFILFMIFFHCKHVHLDTQQFSN